jgi:hypothetical protein
MSWIGRGAALLLLAVATLGCAMPREAGRSSGAASSPINTHPPPSVEATEAPTPSEVAPTSSEVAPTLPPGFPTMADAEPSRLPDDASVVARWTVPVVGSAAYDFYLRTLPDAGFTVVGTYPSERAALIRFQDSKGRIWQLVAELVGDRTQITVQTDRP